jgi:hypothetical protein
MEVNSVFTVQLTARLWSSVKIGPTDGSSVVYISYNSLAGNRYSDVVLLE